MFSGKIPESIVYIDQLQRQYRYKGKFPIIISCRFKDRLVDGQKEGEWIDKTFLGMIYFRLRDRLSQIA